MQWNTDKRCNVDESQKHDAEGGKPDAKDCIVSDFISMKCAEKANL